MFVRFRKSGAWRLKVYLVHNTRHRLGKIAQETIAYLGGIDTRHLGEQPDEEREALSIRARTAFWEIAGPRLTALVNRIGGDEAVKRLRLAIHARIPWPMQAERARLDILYPLLEAQHEAKSWHGLYELTQKKIADNNELMASIAEEKARLVQDGMREIAQANMWKATAESLRSKSR
jgi:hypothetical protein